MTLRLTTDELNTLLNKSEPVKQGKPNKYRNVKTGGYHSKKEAARAGELKFMQRGGLITDLVEQPKFVLIPKQDGERPVTYTADFSYEQDGRTIIEDVKSEATAVASDYIIKRKLMLYIHGIKILQT